MAETVTFYSTRTGVPYETSDPVEITRLRAGRSHVESKPQAEAQLFDPREHDVKTVLQYMKENPEDAERVKAVELAADSPRVGIVGAQE